MPGPEYKELETTEIVNRGYNAQNSLEEKFLYTLNLCARNHMIDASGFFLTEKERLELGMMPDTNIRFMTKPRSKLQNDMQEMLGRKRNLDLQKAFFPKGKDKKPAVNVNACRRFFEYYGALPVKPYIDLGKRYDEISALIPAEGNTAQDLHYKTNYLLRYGPPIGQAMITQMHMQMRDIEGEFYTNSFYTDAKGNNKQRGVYIENFLEKEIAKSRDKTLGQFLDEMEITDPEERASIAKQASGDETVSLAAFQGGVGEEGLSDSSLAQRIASAWTNQGWKKALGALSEKELLAYKRGYEASEIRDEKQYKSWIKGEAEELIKGLQRKEYKKAFAACNKMIHQTKPIGFSVPEDVNPVSFSQVEQIRTESRVDRVKNPSKADTLDRQKRRNRAEAERKYDAYILDHTGAGKLSDQREKNLEMLSKAMAATVLRTNKQVTDYSTKTIHSTAEKLMGALDLSGLSDEQIKKALESPDNTKTLTGLRMRELYKPEDTHGLIQSMQSLGRHMMPEYDRSPEYQSLVRSVRALGALNSDKYMDPEVQQQAMNAGFQVLLATENYMKGKKSVRSSDDGKERFNNALDSLSILRQGMPGLKVHIDQLVARINTVRKAQGPEHEDYVDITCYGSQRAVQAKEAYTRKVQGAAAPQAATAPQAAAAP